MEREKCWYCGVELAPQNRSSKDSKLCIECEKVSCPKCGAIIFPEFGICFSCYKELFLSDIAFS